MVLRNVSFSPVGDGNFTGSIFLCKSDDETTSHPLLLFEVSDVRGICLWHCWNLPKKFCLTGVCQMRKRSVILPPEKILLELL